MSVSRTLPCCWSKSILAPLCFTGFFAIHGLRARSHCATDFKGIADCKVIHLNHDEGGGGRGRVRGWWWWWMIDDGLSMIMHDWRCMVHDIAWWMVWWGDGRRDGWLAGWWNSQKDFWVQVKPACDILWPWKLWKYSWWPLFYRRLAALKSSKQVQNKFASSSSKTKNKGMPSWKDRSLTSAFCFSSTATAALCQTPYSRGEVVVECSSRHFLASTIALKRLLKQQRRNLPKSAATKSANINKDTKNKTR